MNRKTAYTRRKWGLIFDRVLLQHRVVFARFYTTISYQLHVPIIICMGYHLENVHFFEQSTINSLIRVPGMEEKS